MTVTRNERDPRNQKILEKHCRGQTWISARGIGTGMIGPKGNPMTQVAHSRDAEGLAALGICESLVLALTELKVISERSARDLLSDVAAAHTDAAAGSATPERHQAVVDIVHRILEGKNGTR